MCRYKVNILMKYGNFNVNCGDDYNLAMDKYKDIKEEYVEVPCTIEFYDCDKECVYFVKKNGNESFDKLLDNFRNSLSDMVRYQLKLCKEEKKYTKVRNELYHSLEECDLSELTEEEQIKMLFKMKTELSKRRIIEENNKNNYAFYNCFMKCYDALKEYEYDKCKKLEHGAARYSSPYYKEDLSKKKQRVKNILNNFS